MGLLLTTADGIKHCCIVEPGYSADFNHFKPAVKAPKWGHCEIQGHGNIYFHQDKYMRTFARANLTNVPAYPGKMRINLYERARDDNGNTMCRKRRL